MGKAKDLTGKKFGRLTVLKRANDYIQSNGRKRIMWLCECDCGNHIEVMGDNLRNNHTQSCGCFAKESTSKSSRKYNTYDLSNGYGIGYTFKNEEFYFDLEDYEKIKNYCWCKNSNGYIVTNVWENKKNYIVLMHRLIMDFPDICYEIDHKHGKKSRNDNRKSNLRVATHGNNLKNVGVRSNNTSGTTGVSFDRGKWVSRITINGKHMHLGRFENFDDAVAARKEAEEKYFCEFSYDNSMKDVI